MSAEDAWSVSLDMGRSWRPQGRRYVSPRSSKLEAQSPAALAIFA
jgi:hypothetical protein